MVSNKNKIIIVVAVVLGILLVWGIIGGIYANDVGVTCDIGIAGDNLCWKWHKNVVGQIGDAVKDLF